MLGGPGRGEETALLRDPIGRVWGEALCREPPALQPPARRPALRPGARVEAGRSWAAGGPPCPSASGPGDGVAGCWWEPVLRPFPLSGGQPALCPALDPHRSRGGGGAQAEPLCGQDWGLGSPRCPRGRPRSPVPQLGGSGGPPCYCFTQAPVPGPSALLPNVAQTTGLQTGEMRESWGCPQSSGPDSLLPGSLTPQTWGSRTPPTSPQSSLQLWPRTPDAHPSRGLLLALIKTFIVLTIE